MNKQNLDKKMLKPKYYDSIDGLRTISCFGIILMHIQANSSYKMSGNFIFDIFIPSLTWLVYLFLMISGFGMCTGYLEKFQTGHIDLEKFYKRRYAKILPFFGFLLIIALVLEHSLDALFEVSFQILLLHGLLPNNTVSVLGVSWTLGVIFLFYLLFPVFSVLLKSKRRAWLGLLVSLWLDFVCKKYFFGDYFVTESFSARHSFIYCIPVFIIGGLIYLYRNQIKKVCEFNKQLFLLICCAVLILWYLLPIDKKSIIFLILTLVLFALLLSFAIGSDNKFLSSKPMKFFSSISMEMYLAQMLVFRVIEKLRLLYIFGDNGVGGWISLIVTFILTICGLTVFIQCYRFIYKIVIDRYFFRN